MSEAEREARRKKIKALEASLFDSNSTAGVLTAGLPELQKVGEYENSFGFAEKKAKKKSAGLPALKNRAKKIFFPAL